MWVARSAADKSESGLSDVTDCGSSDGTTDGNNSVLTVDGESRGCGGGNEGSRKGACLLLCWFRECDGLSADGERDGACSLSTERNASPEGLEFKRSSEITGIKGEFLDDGGCFWVQASGAINGTWCGTSCPEACGVVAARLSWTSTATHATPNRESTDVTIAAVHVRVEEHLHGLDGGPADEEEQAKDRHSRHHRFLCLFLSFHPFHRDSFFLSSLRRFLRLVCGVA